MGSGRLDDGDWKTGVLVDRAKNKGEMGGKGERSKDHGRGKDRPQHILECMKF